MPFTMTSPEKPKPTRYRPADIEAKWQASWAQQGLYRAADEGEGEKFYALVEFPYPSGDGLHVGHVRSYTAMDAVARKRRMQGYRVLFPIGWDAFGLPAEGYAIKTGIHPAITTKRNADTYRQQMKDMGFSFDWDREVDTTDPAYYRWTQWMFIKFFEAGLAYKAKAFINWCPKDLVGLANEEVIAGCCERCGTPVVQKEKDQWMIRITEYAEKLLAGLDDTEFLPEIRQQQEHWIGKSQGAEITFALSSGDELTVFTTRPDTIFGVTYVVLAPEHPLVTKLKAQAGNEQTIDAYVGAAAKKSERDRAIEAGKSGVSIEGVTAKHPITGDELPVWIADYVLASYGTGAVMAVPAHDERDAAFAVEHNLPNIEVIDANGILVSSGNFTGKDAQAAMTDLVRAAGGTQRTRYKLRDWVFSRQRYWGEPIPMIHCTKCDWQPVPDDQLPVKLPEVERYEPGKDGESPLASIEEWINVPCPKCAGPARRETDVMPNWAGSSWYFLRYVDPRNDEAFASKELLAAWMPVDWYNGGMEHVTLHLLYSRFWNRFLYDQGYVPFAEPYKRRTAQGMVLGPGGKKMSKSKGNVINPDSVVKSHGADTLRTYEMFMGPFDQAIPWDPQSIEGVYRFLARVHAIDAEGKVTKDAEGADLLRAAKKAARKVSDDIETMSFNTAVSALMVWTNEATKAERVPQEAWELFLRALAPFAPHLADELWSRLGHTTSVHAASWPEIADGDIKEDTVRIAVQVSGKTRDEIEVAAGATQEEVVLAARASERIKGFLGEATEVRIVYVPGRIINFVL